MPQDHRLTIRLPQELYTQLTACGWPGQPLSAIVRHALQEYVVRHTDQPSSADETAVTLAAMAARFDGLQDQVETLATRLESLATSTRQTMADVADNGSHGRHLRADNGGHVRQRATTTLQEAAATGRHPAATRRQQHHI